MIQLKQYKGIVVLTISMRQVRTMNQDARILTSSWIALTVFLFGALLTNDSALAARAAPLPKTQTPEPKLGDTRVISSESPLGGTQWQLVEIQPMDDEVGTFRPRDPSQHTMRLNHDGTVTMDLDCNVARGRWSAGASSDPSRGSFEFSPLASTKALCPPPRLGERVMRDIPFVRSYLLKDRRLYLNLMADGGIYVWEPYEETGFLTKPDPMLEVAILKASPTYTQEVIESSGGLGPARYVYGRVDLNDDDGQEEVFAYLMGSFFCGTGGCNLLLFNAAQKGYSLVTEFTTSRLPVIVLDERRKGWRDFIRLESGGGAPASYIRYTFDGKQYVEGERMPADEVPEGKKLSYGRTDF